MKVGVVGVGEMGLAIARHLLGNGHSVSAYDISRERLAAASQQGAAPAADLAMLAKQAEIFLIMVSTDEQSREVTTALAERAAPGSLIAVAATNHPDTMRELAALCAPRKIRFIDAP